ncbi:hypothetical protein MMC12_007264 [Toensbergia leucococca]|nr:hypothetical protein [Toensbergia leucococca]
MATSNQQWNPSQIFKLGEYSPEHESTCIGHAPSKGRRCRNPIAAANRHEASKKLDRIGRMDVMTANLDDFLEDIASRLLCKRWHQNQASTITSVWLSKVEKLRAEMTRQRADDRLGEQIAVLEITDTTATTAATTPTTATTMRTMIFRAAIDTTWETQPQQCTSLIPSSSTPSAPSLAPALPSQNHHHQPSSNTTEDIECPICYVNISDENCKTLQCKHQFCNICIETWLAKHRTCPCCRAEVESEEEEVDSEEEEVASDEEEIVSEEEEVVSEDEDPSP